VAVAIEPEKVKKRERERVRERGRGVVCVCHGVYSRVPEIASNYFVFLLLFCVEGSKKKR